MFAQNKRSTGVFMKSSTKLESLPAEIDARPEWSRIYKASRKRYRRNHDFLRNPGVSKDTDAGGIRSAYRRLARQYHPDSSG